MSSVVGRNLIGVSGSRFRDVFFWGLMRGARYGEPVFRGSQTLLLFCEGWHAGAPVGGEEESLLWGCLFGFPMRRLAGSHGEGGVVILLSLFERIRRHCLFGEVAIRPTSIWRWQHMLWVAGKGLFGFRGVGGVRWMS